MRTRSKTLTFAFVKAVKTPGRYGDGGRGSNGLYLRVWERANGRIGKSWGQRLRIHGRLTNLGLGPADLVSLREARETALENRRAAFRGEDPRGGGVPTFEAATKAVIALRRPNWKPNSRTEAQWLSAFENHVFPRIGRKPVDKITGRDVSAVLTADDLWNRQRATARRVLQWMTAVFQWVTAEGHRADNPATAIRAGLPSNGGRVQHQRAIPWAKVPEALAAIDGLSAQALAKLCLRWVALTACRSGEARQARWEDVDRKAAVWTIPEVGTKSGRQHRVPLSTAALAVLDEAAKLSDGSGLIFPGLRGGRPIGTVTLSRMVKRAGLGGSVHGFRTSFRTWASENGVSRELAESALAHVVANRAEAAYARSDMLEARRNVMERWGAVATG